MPDYVPLTQAHLDAWGDAPCTADDMAGLAAIEGGAVVALGGVYWREGVAWACFDAAPGASPLVHRAAVSLIKAVRAAGETIVHAHCDETRPRARVWLERLGFVEGEDGVWRCELG